MSAVLMKNCVLSLLRGKLEQMTNGNASTGRREEFEAHFHLGYHRQGLQASLMM